MVHCKYLLRPLFNINTFAGLSTVCPDTWGRSNARCTVAMFWLLVYIAEFLLCLQMYLDTDGVTDFQMFTWTANYVLVVYLLLQGLYDHKTLLAAVLTLEAIQDRTEAEGVSIVALDRGFFLTIFMAVSNITLTTFNAVRTWVFYENVKIITSFLTSFHYTALQSASAFSYLTFMFVVLRAEQSVNQALRLGLQDESSQEIATRDVKRTKLLKFVREMKGELYHVQSSLHEYFKMFLTYRFFFACIMLPRMIHYAVFEQGMFLDPIKNGVLVSSFLIVSLFTLFVLYVHGRIADTGPDYQTVLYEYCLGERSQKKKKEFRRMTLACLHRRHTPTCWIFGLEFGVVMTLLDTALLVFLSTSSFTKAKE